MLKQIKKMSNTKSGNGVAIAKIENPTISVVETPKTKNVNFVDFVEKLETLNRKKSFLDKFSERLDQVKDFYAMLDGSALQLVVENQQGKTVEINSNDIIIEFLESVLKKGETFKSNLISELTATSI